MFDAVGVDAGATRELFAKLAGGDARLADEDDLRSASVALVEIGSLVQAARALVLAELDVRQVCDEADGLTAAV